LADVANSRRSDGRASYCVSLKKWKHEPNRLAGRAMQLLLDPTVTRHNL